MARTVPQIQTLIISDLADNGITVSSNLFSRRRIWTYVVSYAIWLLETIFDTHTAEVTADLAALRPPTIEWYETKIKAFQLGFALLADSDQFDNSNATDAAIAASKVIAYSAVQRNQLSNGVVQLRLKLNGTDGTNLTVLDADTLASFGVYLDRFQPAGDSVIYNSNIADNIKMSWTIYYDPTILKADGSRQDGTAATPVQDAIKLFLKTQDQNGGMFFNGRYSITKHIDWVQAVEGVVTPDVISCSASYGSLPFQTIAEYYKPDGGALQFASDADLTITFIADTGN